MPGDGSDQERIGTLHPPLKNGIAATGWKLVCTDRESGYEKQCDSRPEPSRHLYNFAWSIDLTMTDKGEVNDVRWDGSVFKALSAPAPIQLSLE